MSNVLSRAGLRSTYDFTGAASVKAWKSNSIDGDELDGILPWGKRRGEYAQNIVIASSRPSRVEETHLDQLLCGFALDPGVERKWGRDEP